MQRMPASLVDTAIAEFIGRDLIAANRPLKVSLADCGDTTGEFACVGQDTIFLRTVTFPTTSWSISSA
jgi:hypothetical protein